VSRLRADFGTVRKLPSGRWQARYIDASGRRHSRTFGTRGDASRHLAGVRADLDRGAWVDPNRGHDTLATYAERWLTVRRAKGRPLAPRTVALYRHELDRHILPTLGAVQLRHLDATAVRARWAAMTGSAGPGAVTSAKCYRLLHAIMQTAVTDEEVVRNPCAIAGAGIEPTSERPAVSVPDVSALAEAVGPRWRAMVLVAAYCGLRFGELAALTRANLDTLHDPATVTVAASIAELPGGVRHIGPPKSAAGRRTVAIPPHIVADVSEHLDRYAQPGRDGLVFVGPKGGALRESNFNNGVWRPATRAVGVPGAHFHDLRGTAATLAAIAGATTRELMHRLGHATPDVAMRYQRATEDRDAALARMLSEHVSASIARLDDRRSGAGS
jgi:integrase